MKKNIAVLGSTGSIGRQTLEVVDRFPGQLQVKALAALNEVEVLVEQANKYKPEMVALADPSRYVELKEALAGTGATVLAGSEGVVQAACAPGVDTVVTAVVGTAGLLPTIEAIKAGKNIALANKETLVAAGSLVMDLAGKFGVKILPVDSEHSALYQSLASSNPVLVANLWLTASGGPFRGYTKEMMARVKAEDALKHPNWNMGAKITVDSATLMNKGLEVIEARWLFNVPLEQVKVVVHPQSIIHSMVEFVDGSFIAQLGLPDMRLPIQYALSYPQRWGNDFPKADFHRMKDLSFAPPDTDNFPCLELAYAAGRRGGTLPAVMNAANEVAVALFLEGKIGFLAIAELVEKVMGRHQVIDAPDLDQILAADTWARSEALAVGTKQ